MINIINCTSKKDAEFFVDFLNAQGTKSIYNPTYISDTECYGVAIEDNDYDSACMQLSYMTNYDTVGHNFEGNVTWTGGQPFYITVGVSSTIPKKDECIIASIPTVIRKDEIPFGSSKMVADYRIPINFIKPYSASTYWHYSRYLCEIMGEPHNCKVPAIEHGIMAFMKDAPKENTRINVFCDVDNAAMAAIRNKGLEKEDGIIDISIFDFNLSKFNEIAYCEPLQATKFLTNMLCESLKDKVKLSHPELAAQFESGSQKNGLVGILSQLSEIVRINICINIDEHKDIFWLSHLLCCLPKELEMLFNVYVNKSYSPELQPPQVSFWAREFWIRGSKEIIYLGVSRAEDVDNEIASKLGNNNIPFAEVIDPTTSRLSIVCFTEDLKAVGLLEEFENKYKTKKRHGLGPLAKFGVS